jgi:AcrR family transcriptional regulator
MVHVSQVKKAVLTIFWTERIIFQNWTGKPFVRGQCMKERKPRGKNRQVERTRGWIWEALLDLMEEKPYEQISVRDITDKAGIARQTFYYNYQDKDDVIFEYLDHCFDIKTEEASKGGALKQIILVFNQSYIDKERELINRFMALPSIKNRIMLTVLNTPIKFMEKRWEGQSDEEYEISRYKVCYQIAGCMRIIIDWFTSGMKTPMEQLVALLNSMASPREARYRNVPVVVVRLA